MRESLSTYVAQTPASKPGRFARDLAELPADVAGLCDVAQGLIVHASWAERYGLALSTGRRDEVNLRTVERRLARAFELDARPLAEPRPPDRRTVGNCRDFSILLVSMLRARAIPSRARCGFGRYFEAGKHVDHWVAEYWDAGRARWILVDAQLDALQLDVLGVGFDPLDVPRDQFVVAGEAWSACRSGAADPNSFGIADLRGPWFVRGNVVRDLASLNGVETLPWDAWGLADMPDEDCSEGDLALLDRVAALISGDARDLGAIRAIYADSRLQVPRVVTSYTDAGPVQVALG
jgi:hypothetical protein